MTKKDFFILLIKLFGLYSMITALFFSLPQYLSIGFFKSSFQIFFLGTAGIVIIIALFVLLIFKSHRIAKLLKLEKGFDNDHIELGNLNTIEIVKIAIIIIGGFLIIKNIPMFLFQTVSAFMDDINSQPINFSYKYKWILNGLNIIIGYLMLTNLNFIVRILKIKDKKE